MVIDWNHLARGKVMWRVPVNWFVTCALWTRRISWLAQRLRIYQGKLFHGVKRIRPSSSYTPLVKITEHSKNFSLLFSKSEHESIKLNWASETHNLFYVSVSCNAWLIADRTIEIANFTQYCAQHCSSCGFIVMSPLITNTAIIICTKRKTEELPFRESDKIQLTSDRFKI